MINLENPTNTRNSFPAWTAPTQETLNRLVTDMHQVPSDTEVPLYRAIEGKEIRGLVAPELGIAHDSCSWASPLSIGIITGPALCMDCDRPLTSHNLKNTRLIYNTQLRTYETVGLCANCYPHRCSVAGCTKSTSTNTDTGPALCAYHAARKGYRECEVTGLWYPEEQMTRNGRFWIHGDLDPYATCPECGRPIIEGHDDDREEIGDDVYCSLDCALNAGWERCGRCEDGEWYNRDSMRSHEDYGLVCESCYDDLRDTEEVETRNASGRNPYLAGTVPTVGIELELAEWPEEPDREWLPERWGIHADSTAGSGYEVITPILSMTNDADRAELQKVMLYLKRNSSVSRSEGTHIHFGNFASDDHALRFAMLAAESEHLWKNLLAPSRMTNSYCEDSCNASWTLADYGITADGRYYKVNVRSYYKYGTVEIRAHQGTLEFRKIEAWIEIFSGLWKAAQNPASRPTLRNMHAWLIDIGVKSETIAYLQERVDELKERHVALADLAGHPQYPTIGNRAGALFNSPTTWDLLYTLGHSGALDYSDDEENDDEYITIEHAQTVGEAAEAVHLEE